MQDPKDLFSSGLFFAHQIFVIRKAMFCSFVLLVLSVFVNDPLHLPPTLAILIPKPERGLPQSARIPAPKAVKCKQLFGGAQVMLPVLL
jgi:hypothetical protein